MTILPSVEKVITVSTDSRLLHRDRGNALTRRSSIALTVSIDVRCPDTESILAGRATLQ